MSRPPFERFDERFKAWAERPPRTSPEEAARQVLARLDDGGRRGLPRPVWLAAAAAVLLALAVGLFAPRPPVPPRTAEAAAPPLDDGVVLIWLDSETPLYMSFAPPPAAEGDPS
jgi:hypothetical protein